MIEKLIDGGWPAWLLLLGSIVLWAVLLERGFARLRKRTPFDDKDKD